ncbi:hypothetical protein D3H65_04775 [Paraflavitalea soli]|uniref:Uncharacterized protein n=1 Tax=Paraflavitalea soli TaxID=2315862 RepID=A0A3B7MG56_9BACT|nr:hypothetical protein [Paraflavitalea soli]AXY73334.1 hypothetical protein D3H65_04775 [Paraflavitalea soli]
MPFAIVIFMRVLFVASMVFIIGYVFGGFSKRPALASITRVAVVLSIVLFIAFNVLAFRVGAWRHRGGHQQACGWYQQDSVGVQSQK